MARAWTSGRLISKLMSANEVSGATAKGPWSQLLSSLGFVARTPGFQRRTGALVTPRLRLLYPLKNGYRWTPPGDAAGGAGSPHFSSDSWVADHLALGLRVEVTFGAAARAAEPADAFSDSVSPIGTAMSPIDTLSTGVPSPELSPDALAFRERVRVAEQIDDPHLVHIFEQGEVDGVPFLVTELLEGKSFRQRLAHGPASLAEVEMLVTQACETLAHVHGLGIVHGALRPDCLYSVEVADQPLLKIGGFGAPRVASESSPSQSAASDSCEQNEYASPERLEADRDRHSDLARGVQADLWGLAVSAYELLTTTLPFEAPTAAAITAAIDRAHFAPPSHYRADLPRSIDGWFARAFAKDPAQRFAGANDFASGFTQALAEETGAAPHEPRVEAAEMSPPPDAPERIESAAAPAPVGAPAVGPETMPAPAVSSSERSASPITLPLASPAPLAPPPAPAPARAAPPPPSALAATALPAASSSLAEAPIFPAALSPALAVSPPPMPARPPAFDDSLEMEDDEEDEKTVKWDAPSEWAAVQKRAPAAALPTAILPAVVPQPLGGAPKAVSAATPGVATARQLARTQRISRAALQPVAVPPTLEPSVYMDSPYIASIASALAVPSAPLITEVPRARQRFLSPEKIGLAALAFAAGVAVTWLVYDPEPDSDSVATNAPGDEGIRTVRVDDLPRAADEDEDLPVIVRPSQLPRATDEAGPPRTVVAAPGPSSQPPVQRVHALAPAAPKSAPPARAVAKSEPDCTPPYYFDRQGIQRLKSECMNAPTVITGPYGAVMTTTVAAKTAAAASSKPAGSERQARNGASCSPPYYLDGKIRRIKVECL